MDILSIADSWLNQVLGKIPSRSLFLILTFIFFGIMVIWEFFSPVKRVEGGVRSRSYRTNLINLVFNNLIMLAVSIQFFYAIASARSLDLLPWLGKSVGIPMRSFLGIVVQFLILDFLIYAWHLMNHKFDFLWNFHKVHHCDRDLNTSTGIRFHIGELLLSLLFKGMIIITLGVSPEMMSAFEFITVYAAVFHHSNIRVPGESLLKFILIMPSHHATHHSIPRRHHDSNYGVVFSFWDYLFRTRDPHQPSRFGLAGVPELTFPRLFRFALSPIYLFIIISLLGVFLFVNWYLS